MTSHAHSWTYFYVPGAAYRYCACGATSGVNPDKTYFPVPKKEKAFVAKRIEKLEKRANSAKLFLSRRFIIDRPRGTVKRWPQPDGSVKSFTYPVDYGYLPGFKGEDGEGLDFFVGDDPHGHLESFQKLDPKRRLDETKYLVGVTDAEREIIYRLYGAEIWHRKVYCDMDELMRDVERRDGERDLYAVLAKEAGVMDSMRRLFSRGTPTMMPLQNVRPHAGLMRPQQTTGRQAIVPPAPRAAPLPQATTQPMGAHALPATSNAPTRAMQAPTQVGRTPQPIPQTQVTPQAELPAHASNTPAPAKAKAIPQKHTPTNPMPPGGWPVPQPFQTTAPNPNVDTSGLRPTGTTPVQKTTMQDMLMQAPGARESLSDLRVRAAMGARVSNRGDLVTSRPGTTNAMVEHLMRQHPGQRVTPDLILQAMKSPEYAQTRANYKGASAKFAALARYGLKEADLKIAKVKRADIEKLLTGQVMVAGGTPGLDPATRGGTEVERPGEKTAAPDLLYKLAPSVGAAFDAFDAERKRQDFLDAQRDALRYPASHYTQPAMMQFAMGGGDITQAQAPVHHRHRRHHSG